MPLKSEKIKVVILCGGKGTRLREKTESLPKPLIEIGDRPILWHIMKIYSAYGFRDFVLCLGYKGQMIQDYFEEHNEEKWKINFADTGEETQTGGRVKKIAPLIKEDHFMVTYGDGVSDIDIKTLYHFHLKHGKTGTVAAVRPPSQFGLLSLGPQDQVTSFREKPQLDQWINGGFFVFQKKFLRQITANDILEQHPLETLSQKQELIAYKHKGFWKCMDTYKDTITLNETWSSGKAPWRVWP